MHGMAHLGANALMPKYLMCGQKAALRIVRFVTGTAGEVRTVELDEGLNDVLDRIGKRMRLPIAERLAAVRELRVHADEKCLLSSRRRVATGARRRASTMQTPRWETG